ncbi:hypothetical protein COU60_04715 [Candidatus Pacearchaeota archaeon CG10_big_fil_rev_8_21_14_0_10_34_76]|nr:MAG: hypothetical protein COU60_04715 [Candidatus Pacearchaeota archaeon CG10_big_fil_rev_8_21_14_0_10_34_76]
MVSAVSQVGQVADVGGLGFLAPVLAFLIVAIILGALLKKTEILGNNPWTSLIVALGISAIFVSVASIRSLVLDVIPWFAVLLLMLFFLLVLTAFMGKSDMIGKKLGWFFIIAMIVIFFVVGINVFAGSILPYLPGPTFGFGGEPKYLIFFDWFYSPRISGAFWLIVSAIVTGWVLVKSK